MQRYEAQVKSDEAALCRRLREIVRKRPLFRYRWITAVFEARGLDGERLARPSTVPEERPVSAKNGAVTPGHRGVGECL